MLDAVAPEKVREITATLCTLAADGDVPAARLVLEYALGKPVQGVESERAGRRAPGPGLGKGRGGDPGRPGRFPEARFAVAWHLRGLVDDAGRAESPSDTS